ncbi:hard surface induced protein 3 [Diaporthe amygdali]|uniref:hard surface induced protein 3 n=1 Tax=Phomopsis amygdali TaxID=1214568 RepID=UPI0022FEDBBA|nr:hard surface induced protein 3 [Diaporthe amygdali]KAJ0122332.1 hard surface induced protein 3 [Diaporthe amygdali]
MFDRPGHTTHDRDDFPPFIPHEDVEELKDLDGSQEEILFQDGKPVTHSLGANKATRWALGCLLVFVPSFLRSRFIVGLLQVFVPSFLRSGPSEPKKLHPTAWLDGMRGISALCVVIYHSSLLWFNWDLHSGYVPGSMQILKLPIIRLFISGPPHVAIFFVVSGYAISYKALKLAHQGRFAEVGSTLASSFFRRHPRLFMPAVFVTFASALMTQMGWYDLQGLPGVAIPTREPPHAGSFREQMVHFVWTEILNTDPIGQEHPRSGVPRAVENPYDANQWTLPIEFNTSMVVFMFLAAFSRVKNRVRMTFAFVLTVYFEYFWSYWALFLFLAGMLICDVHFEIDNMRAQSAKTMMSEEVAVLPIWARVPQGIFSRIFNKIASSRILGRITSISLFILGLYWLSAPELNYITHMGAVTLVFAVDHAIYLQIIFTNPVSQYLGKISYSLYLIHGPLLWTLGSVLGRRCVAFTGGETNETYVLGIAMAAFLWWPVAIWISDLTYRGVDSKCVQFSRWAYEKLLRKEV